MDYRMAQAIHKYNTKWPYNISLLERKKGETFETIIMLVQGLVFSAKMCFCANTNVTKIFVLKLSQIEFTLRLHLRDMFFFSLRTTFLHHCLSFSIPCVMRFSISFFCCCWEIVSFIFHSTCQLRALHSNYESNIAASSFRWRCIHLSYVLFCLPIPVWFPFSFFRIEISIFNSTLKIEIIFYFSFRLNISTFIDN